MPALRRYLVANLTGGIRHVTSNGRDYLVAHASIINPGVLSGSRGALYYPPEECARNASDWDGIPLTVRHPFDPMSGAHLSAREPGVWSRQGIGRVRNTTFNGKLRCEAWFDVERTKAIDPRILNRLYSGQPLELSTGLYTSNHPAGPNANHRGVPYDHVATNYRPDHLAILPDEVGACSINDGCGVLVNKGVRNANPEGHNQYSGSHGATMMARGASKEAHGYSSSLANFAQGDEDASDYLHPSKNAINASAAAVRASRNGDANLAAEYHKQASYEHDDAAEAHREWGGHDQRHEEAANLHDQAAEGHRSAAKVHGGVTGNRAGDDKKGCGDGG